MLNSVPKPVLFGGLLAIGVVALVVLRPGGGRKSDLELAREAVANREFTLAGEHLDKFLARHPDSPEARLLAAEAARRSGKDDAAERQLTALEKLGGDKDSIELEREMRKSQNGDLSKSNGVMKFATANPDNAYGSLMLEALAQGYMKSRRSREGIAVLDILLTRKASNADKAEWLCWRGELHMGLAQGHEATADLQAAIKLRDDHARARKSLVKMFSRDEPAEAITHLDWLEKHGHREPEMRLELARCRRQLGELTAAAEVMDDLMTSRQDDPDVLTEAGALALARGRAPEAERHLKTSLGLKPDSYDATSMMARCLQELGREKEAKDMREKAKELEAAILRRMEAPKEKS